MGDRGAQLRTFFDAGPERTFALDAHGRKGMTPGAVPGSSWQFSQRHSDIQMQEMEGVPRA